MQLGIINDICYTFLYIIDNKYTSKIPLQRMNSRKQGSKFKNPQNKIVSVNYCIKPKVIINTPLNKYDLSQIPSDIDNLEITDYFNYGFNSQTFSTYVKLLKRFAQIEEIERPNHHYDSKENNQFRFNDDMPIDLGGFGPFLDKQLINFWEDKDVHLHDSLMNYFVKFNICLAFNKNHHQPPLVSFVGLTTSSEENQDYSLSNLIDNFCQRINSKYQRTIKTLRERQASTKIKEQAPKNDVKETNFYENVFNKNKEASEQSSKRPTKRQTLSENQDNDFIGKTDSFSSFNQDSDKDQSSNQSQIKVSHNKSRKQQRNKKRSHEKRKSKKKDKKKREANGSDDDNQKRSKKKAKGRKKSKKIKKHNKKHKKHGKKHKK